MTDVRNPRPLEPGQSSAERAYTAIRVALDAMGCETPQYGTDAAAERERLAAIKLLRAALREQENTSRGSLRSAKEALAKGRPEHD